jgi:hypothetical protein
MDGNFPVPGFPEQITEFGLVEMRFGFERILQEFSHNGSVKSLKARCHIPHPGTQKNIGQNGADG